MSDFSSWRTPSLTRAADRGYQISSAPGAVEPRGLKAELMASTRPNSRAYVQRKAGVCQELAAPFGFRLTPGRRAHLRLAAIPPQSHQSSRVSQLTIARSVPARKCAEGHVAGFRCVGQIADSVGTVSATLNRLLNPAGEPPLLAQERRGVDPSGPCRRVPDPLAAWGIPGGATNGRQTPIQGCQGDNGKTGAHGRLGLTRSYPIGLATGGDRASTLLATAARLDDVRQLGKAGWPTAQRRLLVVAYSARFVQARGHTILPGSRVSPELNNARLGYSCARMPRKHPLLVSGPRAGAGPARCPSSSPPWPVNIHGRATSVCCEAGCT